MSGSWVSAHNLANLGALYKQHSFQLCNPQHTKLSISETLLLHINKSSLCCRMFDLCGNVIPGECDGGSVHQEEKKQQDWDSCDSQGVTCCLPCYIHGLCHWIFIFLPYGLSSCVLRTHTKRKAVHDISSGYMVPRYH